MKHEGVMKGICELRAKAFDHLAAVLSTKGRKGSLVDVVINGSHADRIRAIKELNVMDMREAALGGGETDDIDEIVLKVCRRRRLLPQDDPYDGAIDIETDVRP